jgi:hypothetical protein
LEICIDSTDPPDLAVQNKQANESRAQETVPRVICLSKYFWKSFEIIYLTQQLLYDSYPLSFPGGDEIELPVVGHAPR